MAELKVQEHSVKSFFFVFVFKDPAHLGVLKTSCNPGGHPNTDWILENIMTIVSILLDVKMVVTQ